MGWTEKEFDGIDLGDKRLDKRVVLLADRLSAKPTASITGACHGWAETQAACRSLSQEEIEWSGILRPHWECTQERMAAHRVVLCLAGHHQA